MDTTGLVERIRDYRFQAIVGLVALVAALVAAQASDLLAFGIVALGVAAVVFLSFLDHRHRARQQALDDQRAARPVGEVALIFPADVAPSDIDIAQINCVVRHVRKAEQARTVLTEAYLGPGGWLCPLPEMEADEILLIQFEDASGGRWRVPRFAPGDLTPRVEVRPDVPAAPRLV